MKYIIPKESTVLEALAVIQPDSSMTTLRSLLKEGRVSVDGKKVIKANIKLKEGQELDIKEKLRYVRGLNILYVDAHFVVVDKPAGLLSVSTDFETRRTVYAFLKEEFHPRKVYVVHRLDQETSGVMVFALSEPGLDRLKELFKKHDIERCYTALVEGRVKPAEGTWECYLWEDDYYRVHVTEDPDKGELAITNYRVTGNSRKLSRLDIRLHTGKKNQIRVHCSQAGHPVVGDEKYGADGDPISRLCLHASRLAFEHPFTGKKMVFESPVPEIFSRLVKEKQQEKSDEDE